MSNNFKKIMNLSILLAASFMLKAQPVTIELLRRDGTPDNGPSIANLGPIIMNKDFNQQNASSSFALTAGAELTNVTFKLTNQQYTGNYTNVTKGLCFGGTTTTAFAPDPSGAGIQSVDGVQMYRNIGNYSVPAGPGAPTVAMFQSHPLLATGTLNVSGGNPDRQTGAASIFTVAQFLYDQGVQNNANPAPQPYNSATSYYYGDLVIEFNRYVKDPIVHLAGLGGSYFYLPANSTAPASQPSSWRKTYFATELRSNYTLVQLKGNSIMQVSGGNILNNAAKPDGASEAQNITSSDPFTHLGAASGSVLVSGTYKVLTFRVYLRGADITDPATEFAWSAPGSATNNDPFTTRNPVTGDVWHVSVTTTPTDLIPLPATGVNLSATLVGNDVNLIWKTLSEFNTNHFEVERSTDGVNFVRIGEKAAAGNSVSEKSYTYGDANITAAMYYYRLKMVDMDGKVAYSNVARVNKSHIKTIKTFPNPVTDVINIEFASSKGSYTVTLVNQGGQEVKAVKADITNTTQYVRMDRGELPTGMYYVRVKDNASGQVFAEKIIIK
jgi:archaellum component FlaF (FlaF/FlaG flagellin family)